MNDETGIYRLLQQHLDKQPVGFPATGSGADITLLKRLFEPDEARLALHLTYKPTPIGRIIGQVAREFPAGQAERLLESMFGKGAIGWKEKNGVGHWYVMPLLIGMYEHQDGEPAPEFLADAFAYMQSGEFGEELLAVTPPQMRTIPVNKSISVEHHIATYDNIRAIVETGRGPFVVLKCICREVAAMNEKPCGQTSRLETCLGFNDFAAAILRRDHGREITRDETLEILRQNEEDGLVLQPANSRNPDFVCSCCGCCCGMLNLQKSLPRPIDFWTSNYYATVDTEACSQCGICVSRCQVAAVNLTGPDDSAQIDLNRCIGCGLCVSTCPPKALALKKKDPVTVPPRDEEALHDEIMANKNKPDS